MHHASIRQVAASLVARAHAVLCRLPFWRHPSEVWGLGAELSNVINRTLAPQGTPALTRPHSNKAIRASMDFPDDDSGRASVLSFAGASAGSSVRSLTQIFVDRSGGLEPLMGFEQVYPAEGTVSFEPVAE